MKITGKVEGKGRLQALLGALVESSKSGTLLVTDGKTQWKLFLENGDIIAGSSTDPAESFSSFLLQNRLVLQSLLPRAEELARQRGSLLGHALVDLGCLTEQAAADAIRTQTRNTVSRMLSDPQNRFEFSDERLRDGDRFHVALRVEEIFPDESSAESPQEKAPAASVRSESTVPTERTMVDRSTAEPPASPPAASAPPDPGPSTAGGSRGAPSPSSPLPDPKPVPKPAPQGTDADSEAERRSVGSRNIVHPRRNLPESSPGAPARGHARKPEGRSRVPVLAGIFVAAGLVLGLGYWLLRSSERAPSLPNWGEGGQAESSAAGAAETNPSTVASEASPPLEAESPKEEAAPKTSPPVTARAPAPTTRSEERPETREPQRRVAAVHSPPKGTQASAPPPPRPAPTRAPAPEPPPKETSPIGQDEPQEMGSQPSPSASPTVAEAGSREPVVPPAPVASPPMEASAPSEAPATPPPDSAPKQIEPPVPTEAATGANGSVVRTGDFVLPGDDVIAPRVVTIPPLEYPAAAKPLKIEATVEVRVLVDENGKVLQAKVDKQVGHGFDEATLKAARGMSFEPATKAGIRVKMWTKVKLHYSVEEDF